MTWRKISLGAVLPFKYGKSLPARVRSESGEFHVVSSAGVTGSHNLALTEGPSVVIGRKGTIGAAYYCHEPVWPIDTTFYVEGSKNIDIRYAFYLLKTLPLRSMNNDSAVPGLNRVQAERLSILLPPLNEQWGIAATLGALDDKIESNRRCRSIGRQLGISMVRAAKSDEQVFSLGDFTASISRGVTPRYADDISDSVQVLNQRCIRGGWVSLESARTMLPRKTTAAEKISRHGDVLINSTGQGTLGRVARWGGANIHVDSHVTVVKPDSSKELSV